MKWFESWFDTEYYHLLYKHRNYEEARIFIEKLVHFLSLKQGCRVVDIGCGKGRHAMVLADLGLNVWGLDLSENSIAYAKGKVEELGLVGIDFSVHDMREPYPIGDLSAVFNLFTSFGYFENTADDLKAVRAMAGNLISGGYVVQDYLNAAPLIAQAENGLLQPLTWQTIDGVDFGTEKRIADGRIYKKIFVDDRRGEEQGKSVNRLEFQEEVKIYSSSALVDLHRDSDLQLVKMFGNYQLDDFDKDFSPRIIIVSKKK
jgi:SAM-dependent methyltransferase